MEGTSRILEAIRQHSGEAVMVVAIDGRSAAGKSKLAGLLAALVDGAVVHVDDFYRDLPEAERLALTPRDGVRRYFDWERLREEALIPLSEHKRARFRRFDWIAGAGLASEVTVEPRRVVIVEGVYSTRPEFDDLVSLKVLVEAPDDERERRRRVRHDPHHWEQRWDAAEQLYFSEVRPREAFDVVVAGDAEAVDNPSAPVGKAEKYARIERERRWLLQAAPGIATASAEVEITDTYFGGTRLRLRRVDDVRRNSPPIYKLAQKVPASPAAVLLTNIYLSETEYRLLSRLEGQRLQKRRYTVPPFAVDVFLPPLDGLILAEAEFEPDGALAQCGPPQHAVAEVTDDPRFTGGQLALASRDEVSAHLAGFGLRLR